MVNPRLTMVGIRLVMACCHGMAFNQCLNMRGSSGGLPHAADAMLYNLKLTNK